MTLTNLAKAPFPWFGGKSKAAGLVWRLLGDVDHYVEPFAGSLAVLLNRPHPCNRPYFSETVNDMDGLLVNAWRGIQLAPEATADAASWPVSEACKTARQIALLRWQREHDLERLAGDPLWCDPVMAGWWLWAVSVQIGAFSGDGPWTADSVTGRIFKQARAPREPGVSRGLPQLSDDGRGVNRQGAREPGVSRGLPHLTGNGRGVNRQGAREPGVSTPPDPDNFHPVTMPELTRWFQYLSARLRHVRILNGDWQRTITTGARHTINVREGGIAGILLDPPYATDERANNLYAHDTGTPAADTLAWCIKHGHSARDRIVLCGYTGEHGILHELGWTQHEWFTDGYMTGGYAQGSQDGHQQHRERLWASPGCLDTSPADTHEQLALSGRDDE